MWERFSYYGMRALLILFMTAAPAAGGLGFDTGTAGAIYGLYTSMVYMTSLPGGWIADRLIGQRRAVLYGGILIAGGHFSMAFPSLVDVLSRSDADRARHRPAQGQHQRASSASCTPRTTSGATPASRSSTWGSTSARSSRRWSAAISASGSTGTSASPRPASAWRSASIQYVLGGKYLGDGRSASRRRRRRPQARGDAAAAALSSGAAARSRVLVAGRRRSRHRRARDHADAGRRRSPAYCCSSSPSVFFGWLFLAGDWTPAERSRLYVIGVFFLAAALFWSVFEQAGSTLNLFADRDTQQRRSSAWSSRAAGSSRSTRCSSSRSRRCSPGSGCGSGRGSRRARPSSPSG